MLKAKTVSVLQATVTWTSSTISHSVVSMSSWSTSPVLVSALSLLVTSLFLSHGLHFITSQYPWISATSYFQTSSKDILFSVSLPPFSCPFCLEYLTRPDYSKTLALYKSFTYLLTYVSHTDTAAFSKLFTEFTEATNAYRHRWHECTQASTIYSLLSYINRFWNCISDSTPIL